jgi:hypothetical protein
MARFVGASSGDVRRIQRHERIGDRQDIFESTG